MVVHTWRAAAQHPAIDSACVATDHPEIADAVREAGGEVILTASSHSTGTDRCLEAWKKWGRQGAVINLQGDEPFPEPTHISAICTALKSGLTDVVSAMRPATDEEAKRPERVKVATNESHRALYFSRSPIPTVGRIMCTWAFMDLRRTCSPIAPPFLWAGSKPSKSWNSCGGSRRVSPSAWSALTVNLGRAPWTLWRT